MSDIRIVGRTLNRLFYLTLAEYPLNWIDDSFQRKFGDFKKLHCIDEFYEVFMEDKYRILRRNGKSVYEYIRHPIISEFPSIEGEKFTQEQLAKYLTRKFLVLKERLEKKDKEVMQFFNDLRMLDANGHLAFTELNQAPVFKILLFKTIVEETRKGTGLLICMLLLWGIKNRDITGKGIQHYEQIANVYSCFAKKSVNKGLNLNKAFEKLNKFLGTDYKHNFKCDRFEVR